MTWIYLTGTFLRHKTAVAPKHRVHFYVLCTLWPITIFTLISRCFIYIRPLNNHSFRSFCFSQNLLTTLDIAVHCKVLYGGTFPDVRCCTVGFLGNVENTVHIQTIHRKSHRSMYGGPFSAAVQLYGGNMFGVKTRLRKKQCTYSNRTRNTTVRPRPGSYLLRSFYSRFKTWIFRKRLQKIQAIKCW